MLIELIGLAGAGKSTLWRLLHQQNIPTFGDRLVVRDLKNLPFFVKASVPMLPALFRLPWHGRWFTGKEIFRMLYVTGMPRVFRHIQQDGRPLVLDHGPIFEMATLYGFGPEMLQSRLYHTWWEQTFKQWTQTLDLVIWLRAPKEILISRIRSRVGEHAVKQSSIEAASAFLERYEAAYEHVLARLSASRLLPILTFDTSAQTPEVLLSSISSLIGQGAVAA